MQKIVCFLCQPKTIAVLWGITALGGGVAIYQKNKIHRSVSELKESFIQLQSSVNELQDVNISTLKDEINTSSSKLRIGLPKSLRINPSIIPSVFGKAFQDSLSTVVSTPKASRIDEFKYFSSINSNNFHGLKIVLGNRAAYPFDNMIQSTLSGMDLIRVAALGLGEYQGRVSINIHATDARGNKLVDVVEGHISNFGNVPIYLSPSFIEIYDKRGDLSCGLYAVGANEFLYQGYYRSLKKIVVCGLNGVIELPTSASDADVKAAITETGVYAISPTARYM